MPEASRPPVFEGSGGSALDLFFGTQLDPAALDQQAIDTARSYAEQMTACVREQGFAWFIEPAEPIVPGAYAPRPLAAQLTDYGYGPVFHLEALAALALGSPEVPAIDQTRQAQIAAMTPPEQTVFFQVLDTCSIESRRDNPPPGTDLSGADAEVAAEISHALAEISQHPGFATIEGEWAECMRAHGWEFDSRRSIADSFAVESLSLQQDIFTAQADSVRSEEIRLAIDRLGVREATILSDDLACSAQTKSDERMLELQARLERELLEQSGDRWTLMLNSEGS